ALNDVAKPIRGSKIAILGVSYKSGIGDMRESPALKIIEMLIARGAELVYHDPFVPALEQFGLASVELADAVEDADAVVLVTAHPGVPHLDIARQASLFVDLRGITRGVTSENLVRL
ncbi:MAG: hypothetical protein FWD04_11200, partial [Conexibacteraceae bacterium]|nr:hypothetical protein [Conexibacteraceae bacterium]